MYHPPTKRKQLIRQVAVYTAMSVTIAVVVTGLVLLMLGYNFNRKDGRIEQGGLIQFASNPTGADVTIDGNTLGSQTPSKTTAFTGQHFVAMNKLGYRTWQKSVDVLPGSVLWLNYARLIPTTLTPVSVHEFATLSSTAASPDNKLYALMQDASQPDIGLVNINDNKTPITTLTIPETIYSQPSAGMTQNFSLESWDNASRYLIVRHLYDETKIEWLIVDTQDVTRTKNVTTLLGVDASQIMFHNSDNKIIFALIGTDLRQIDLDAQTLSRPLVTNVAEFQLSSASTISYVTTVNSDTETRDVGYLQIGNEKPVVLQTYAGSEQTLHVAIGSYFNEAYIAINHNDTVDIFKGALPKTTIADSDLSSVATFKVEAGAEWLDIISGGRFVTLQQGATYTVYDIELNKMTTTTLKGDVPQTKKLQWLDGYTVWSDNNGTLRLYEFDGANQQDIMPIAPGFSVILSPNGTFLYAVAKNAAGTYQLQRVQLVLN